MRLMGNGAYEVEPNHAEIYINTSVLKTFQDLQASISNDPGMLKGVSGEVVYEVLGAPNTDVQRYILENSKDMGNWIPGSSPYVPSTALPGDTVTPSISTVPCANFDANCKADLSQSSGALLDQLSAQQRSDAADYLGQAGTKYQRISLLAAGAGRADIAMTYEIAAAAANVMEQTLRPSTGKVSLDIAMDAAIDAVSRKTGVPKSVLFEIAEQKVKPLMGAAIKKIDDHINQ